MNNENKIDLSIEMYEDLKETLVKTIKNAKAGSAGNAGLENVQLGRIERLIGPWNARRGKSRNCWNTYNGIRPCRE